MKKYSFLALITSVFVLAGCGSVSPEQTYLDALQPQLAHMDTMGSTMNTLGDQLLDENFNQAYTTLGLLRDDLQMINLPAYSGTEGDLKIAATSLGKVVEGVNTLISTLDPVLQKAAADENAPMSETDMAAVQTVEGLTKTIAEDMDSAAAALDTYLGTQE